LKAWLKYFTLDNPIFDKEMRLRWQRGRLWILPAIAVGAAVALMLIAAAFGSIEPGYLRKTYPLIACVMGYVIATVVALLVTPALTAGALAGERQQRTLEMLMITRLTSWHIIIGKLAPALLPIVLAIVPCLCLSSFFALIGSALDPTRRYWEYWTTAGLQWLTVPLCATFAACTGMFFSALCPNRPSATAWAYAITLGAYVASRHGLQFMAALGLINVDPRAHTVADIVGRAAIVWIVCAWLAAAGLFGARWRLEREAEVQ
jgi:ABC-type transport system involved in multi-copper enzyme maturation permease subunit